MKILFVWPGLTGYMGDCWRELAGRSGVELKVVVDLVDTHFGGGFKAEDVMRGLDWNENLPKGWMPNVAFIVGWHNRLCREAVLCEALKEVPKVCCFDMPWEWKLRKIAARFVLWPFLRHYDAAYIPGMATRPYAKWLGFKRVYEGLFSTDLTRFGQHVGGDGFVFIGRDAPEKGIDVLKSAHRIYQSRGGTLPLKIVTGVSPSRLGDVYTKADCLVLPSRWEPWGVVLAEAAGAGVPIICSDKCGARHEVVCNDVNGIVVRSGDANGLAEAMAKAEGLDGEKGRLLAASFSCQCWADRVLDIVEDLRK